MEIVRRAAGGCPRLQRRVWIRTVVEQEIEHIEIGPGDMHGRALEAEHRLIDVGDQITVGSEQLPHLIDIMKMSMTWRSDSDNSVTRRIIRCPRGKFRESQRNDGRRK